MPISPGSAIVLGMNRSDMEELLELEAAAGAEMERPAPALVQAPRPRIGVRRKLVPPAVTKISRPRRRKPLTEQQVFDLLFKDRPLSRPSQQERVKYWGNNLNPWRFRT